MLGTVLDTKYIESGRPSLRLYYFDVSLKTVEGAWCQTDLDLILVALFWEGCLKLI